MKITLAPVLLSLALVTEISAGLISHVPRSHHMLSRRLTRQKRCIQRQQGNSSAGGSPTSSNPPPPANTPAQNNQQDPHNQPQPSQGGGGGGSGGGSGGGGGGGSHSGTIQVQNAPCGDPNASPVPTVDSGPNGSAAWLTCGVPSGGWQPPPIFRENVIYVDLGSVTGPGQVFSSCAPYLDIFNQFAGQTGIPAILLASIASQESGCNPRARGPNGEYGLMQITPDKCPVQDDSCLDPYTNISIGAQYFANVVDGNGGNLALAMGMYNGWFIGITEAAANSALTCGARNNLDYLHDVFNGFMQGRDPNASPQMGTYFNVQNC